KAGAAFLMLDPRQPAPRQAQMLHVARPAAWLRLAAAGPVPAEIESALDALGCACRLTLPARAEDCRFLAEILADTPAEPHALQVGPDDPAYVAFTSGSTGVPKGVLGRHGSLSHFIPWLRDRFGLSAADRFSLLSGLAHDPLHRDLFTPLQIGAAIVIPDPETMDEPGRLAAWMRETGVTVVHLTPALGQVLTTEAPNTGHVEVPSLRYTFLVGDVLTRRDVARLRRLAPAVTCVNYYGSTETQRAVGYHVARDGEPREVLPLGHGIPDVQLLVLNPAGALAGIGELGEISVRSPHIALGYLGDPQLTAERFVRDRYRTGDLGRYLPNGEAVFAGRADTQVKIRGFRIELGEIEAVLASFPGVREAVVIARQDGGRERSLAAYLVPAPGADLEVRELRSYLRGQLPDAMVPAAFVVLERMPLTPNRKVDRKALPAPERGSSGEGWQAPRTPSEEALAGIWADLLRLDRVGATDNFFDLGGHSLLAVRVMARVESLFGVKVPISTLFEAPTVERLAAVLDRGQVRRSPVVRLHGNGTGRPLFLLHPIGGDVFSYRELARKLGADRPVYALPAILSANGNGRGNGHGPTLEELAAQYLATLREVQPEGPWLLAGWSFGAVLAYEMARQMESSGSTGRFLAMIDPPPPPKGSHEGIDDLRLLLGFAQARNRSERQRAFLREQLQGLDVDAGLDRLIEIGSAEGLLPPDVDRSRLREHFDRYCSNVRALHGYVPRPYEGRTTLFRASGSLAPGAEDLTSGWGVLVDSKVHLLDADHESVLRSPALDRLVEELRQDLAKVE
ncbi:MAG TPA: AMP-binding protein, partial [Thermoanaerobaculia bacterium]|nr:AMP-binding protein [Thermoanaerobaculia bacterium]